MSYYEQKKSELTSLLKLIQEEQEKLRTIASSGEAWFAEKAKRFEEERKEALREIKEREKELKAAKDYFAKYKKNIEEDITRLDQKSKERNEEDKEALLQLSKEKTQGFPWLSKAWADYVHYQDLKRADYLEHKAHPAEKAAEEVRRIASQRRIAEELYRVLKYKLEYYENLFPWLVDFSGEDVEDLIIEIIEKKQKGKDTEPEPDDPAKKWLTPAEYATLSTAEKYQKALERYWTKKKSKWEIGRDYERFIGYLYESRGYAVHYQGIVEGLADLGRDLVCVRNNEAEVVQCKYWSKDKQIHEKHIFQLFGTMTAYRIDNPKQKVSATFVTSTSLTDKAKLFAKELKVKQTDNYPLKPYPCIKCNVARRDGEKIYHLPFDQQYDKTLVEEERNECYVETVAEAEALGFRRAFRWRGESQD